MFLKHRLQNNKGFTMIETLAAIFILLIATTGPMVFSQSGLRAAFQSRDQITAFYLAQDALEFIKNRRDHNVLTGGSIDWLIGLNPCIGNNIGCTIDTTSVNGNIKSCNGNSEPGCLNRNPSHNSIGVPLKINQDGYTTNISDDKYKNSLFTREIMIEPTGGDIDDATEIKVTVKIRWSSHDTIGTREIEVIEYMYNWAQALGI